MAENPPPPLPSDDSTSEIPEEPDYNGESDDWEDQDTTSDEMDEEEEETSSEVTTVSGVSGRFSGQPIFLRHFIAVVERNTGTSAPILRSVLGMKYEKLADLEEKAKALFLCEAKRDCLMSEIQLEITKIIATHASP